ncbi:MAG: hypothetical protein ABSG83_10570 [Roseiarcus sp.]|jgi:hypothetical protein
MVPARAPIQARLLFGRTLDRRQVAGMALTAAGVAPLASRRPAGRRIARAPAPSHVAMR